MDVKKALKKTHYFLKILKTQTKEIYCNLANTAVLYCDPIGT